MTIQHSDNVDIFGDNVPDEKKKELDENIREQGFNEGQALSAKEFNGMMEKVQKWSKYFKSERDEIFDEKIPEIKNNLKNLNDTKVPEIENKIKVVDNKIPGINQKITSNQDAIKDINENKIHWINSQISTINTTKIPGINNQVESIKNNIKTINDTTIQGVEEQIKVVDDNNSELINRLEQRINDLETRNKEDIGQIAYFPTTLRPPNYLKLDGRTVYDAVDNSAYLDLYDWILSQHNADNKIIVETGTSVSNISNTIGKYIDDITHSTFGYAYSPNIFGKFFKIQAANGQKKFRLPNFQGLFFRALDEGQGADPNRDSSSSKILNYQYDTFKNHRHELPIDNLPRNGRDMQSLIRTSHGNSGFGTSGGRTSQDEISQRPHYTGYYNGSSETRPKSVQLCAFIKYR